MQFSPAVLWRSNIVVFEDIRLAKNRLIVVSTRLQAVALHAAVTEVTVMFDATVGLADWVQVFLQVDFVQAEPIGNVLALIERLHGLLGSAHRFEDRVATLVGSVSINSKRKSLLCWRGQFVAVETIVADRRVIIQIRIIKQRVIGSELLTRVLSAMGSVSGDFATIGRGWRIFHLFLALVNDLQSNGRVLRRRLLVVHTDVGDRFDSGAERNCG